jgi:hypothetical protein
MAATEPKSPKTIWDRLMSVDRRIIFVFVALSVALPLLFPIGLPVRPARESESFFQELEQLQEGDVIMFSFDYEPDTMAELDPMSIERTCRSRWSPYH